MVLEHTYNFYFTKSPEEGKTADPVSILPMDEALLEKICSISYYCLWGFGQDTSSSWTLAFSSKKRVENNYSWSYFEDKLYKILKSLYHSWHYIGSYDYDYDYY